jgi:hypothetical protein
MMEAADIAHSLVERLGKDSAKAALEALRQAPREWREILTKHVPIDYDSRVQTPQVDAAWSAMIDLIDAARGRQ